MSFFKIPILMYHEVTAENKLDEISNKIGLSWIVFNKDFEDQIAFLHENGYESITLDQLIKYMDGNVENQSFPLKPVLITFDDGFIGNYQYAFPLLQKHGMIASFFVVVDEIGNENVLTWNQLREMDKFKMSILSHTLTHPLLSCLDFEDTRRELLDSKLIIQDKIGKKVDFISLPNGDYNKHYFKIAEDSGYSGGCSSLYGFNSIKTNRFLLRRIAIRQNMDIATFEMLLDSNSLSTKMMVFKSLLKRGLTKAVSKKLYDKVYNSYYGVASKKVVINKNT